MIGRGAGLLAVAAFAVASDATLAVALLPQIAAALHVSPASAGQAVTAYAAGYALGSPLIVRIAHRARQVRLMAAALGTFALANAATGAAPALAILLAARAAAGSCGGAFMAAAAAAAARSSSRDHQGRALAVLVAGSSAGTAFGVPLGTFAAGTAGWRPAFLGVAVAAMLTAAVIMWRGRGREPLPVPDTTLIPRGTALLTLATTLLWATGSFTFFTYIGVVLHRETGVGAIGLAGLLLLFGVAGLGGAAAGGWLADKVGPLKALSAALALTAASIGGFGVLATFPFGPAVTLASAAAIMVYGLGTWAVTPPQQQRLLAGGGGRVLLSLNASALYAGVALGSLTGGLTLSLSHGVAAVCWTGAAVEVAALVLVRRAAGADLA